MSKVKNNLHVIVPLLVIAAGLIALCSFAYIVQKSYDDNQKNKIEIVKESLQLASQGQEELQRRGLKYSDSRLDLYDMRPQLEQLLEENDLSLAIETDLDGDEYEMSITDSDFSFSIENDGDEQISRECDSYFSCQDGQWAAER